MRARSFLKFVCRQGHRIFLHALLTLGIGVLTARAQDQGGWKMVGQIGGATQAMAVQGSYAYAGVGMRLVVLDVSNPSDLREVGVTPPFPHLVEDIAVSGTLAYVAAGAAGLRVVDVSNPALPAEIGAWDSRGYAQGVTVAGTIAYLADGPYGLRLVDVSKPSQPVEIGSAYPMNYAFDVAVQGHYAYIAAAGAGLLVADITDAAHPREVFQLGTPGYAVGVTLVNDTAYVADAWKGIQVVSVATPDRPERVGSVQTPGWAFDIAVSGAAAYVADALGGLQILDVSEPSRPRTVGAFLPDGRTDCRKAAVSGDVVFVADLGKGIRAVRVSDPSKPVQVATYGPVPYARDVAVSGNLVLVAAAWGGVRIVDVSDPARPREVAAVDVKVEADRIAVSGATACVRAGTDVGETDDARLTVLDVSNPTKPTTLSSFFYSHPPPSIQSLSIADGFLYVTDEFGLAVISIRDPGNPSQVGYTEVNGAWGLVVDGHRAYVASTHRGLNILDVPEQGDPKLLGSVQFTTGTGQARDVVVAGNLAYVAEHGYGLHVVNVADPLHPSIVGSSGEASEALAVAVTGNDAFIASGDGGVRAFDVTRPDSPLFAGWIDTAGYAFVVAAQGDHVYVADGPGGLLILERGTVNAAEAGRLDARSSKSTPARFPTAPFPQESYRLGAGSLWPLTARHRDPEVQSQDRRPGERAVPVDLPRSPNALASACLVKTTSDSGEGSLSSCIQSAASGSTITFDPSLFPPSHPATIFVHNPLPALQQGNITIDGSDAGVIIDGTNAAKNASGLIIPSGGNVVRGLQIVNFQNAGIAFNNLARNNTIGGDRGIGAGPTGQGCVISGNTDGISFFGAGVSGNVIEGNLIGTDAEGMRAVPNRGFGLFVMDSSRNRIGGASPGRSNVISGNSTGVDIQRFHASGNQVTGNIIGLALDGKTPLGNQVGVSVQLGASANRIEKNVISANAQEGVLVVDERSSYNVIAGNLIGTDADGHEARGNLGWVAVQQYALQGCNLLGGKTAEERNVIAGNAGGLAVSGSENFVIGNFIGTNINGTGAIDGTSGGLNISGTHNFIGGFSPEERNLISATRSGLWIGARGTQSNFVMGNYVGTDVSGQVALPNSADGITVGMDGERTFIQANVVSGNAGSGAHIQSGDGNRLRGNFIGTAADGSSPLGNRNDGVKVEGSSNGIGGAMPGDGNVVAHNSGRGVAVISGTANLIGGNSIYANGTGIQLVAGGNNGLTTPVVSSVSNASVSGHACPVCRVEIFSDSEGQGRLFEGSVVADGSGTFAFTKAYSYLTGPNVTATATDTDGSTSAFSEPMTVPPKPPRRRAARH